MDISGAVFQLNPSIVKMIGDVAYGKDGNQVAYDKEAAEAKLVEMQAEEEAKQQSQVAAKESALAKLAKLGLTEDEVKALVG